MSMSTRLRSRNSVQFHPAPITGPSVESGPIVGAAFPALTRVVADSPRGRLFTPPSVQVPSQGNSTVMGPYAASLSALDRRRVHSAETLRPNGGQRRDNGLSFVDRLNQHVPRDSSGASQPHYLNDGETSYLVAGSSVERRENSNLRAGTDTYDDISPLSHFRSNVGPPAGDTAVHAPRNGTAPQPRVVPVIFGEDDSPQSVHGSRQNPPSVPHGREIPPARTPMLVDLNETVPGNTTSMEIARIPDDNAATLAVDGKIRQALGKIPTYKYGARKGEWRSFYSSLKAHLQLAGVIDYAAGVDWAAAHPHLVHPSWNATLYSLLVTHFDEVSKSMTATVPEGDGVALFRTAKFQAEGSMKVLPQFIVEATNLNKLTFDESKETLNQYFERAQILFELYSRHFSSALPHFMLCAYVLQGLPPRFQVLRDFIYMQYDKTTCHLMTFHTLVMNWMHDNPVKVGGAFGVDVDKSKMQCFLCGAAGHGTKHCSSRGSLKDQKCPTCSAVGHNAAGCAAKTAYQVRKAAASSGAVNFVLGVTDAMAVADAPDSAPRDLPQHVRAAWSELMQFERSFLAENDWVLDEASPVSDLSSGFPWSYDVTTEYNYDTQTFTREAPVPLSVPWVFPYTTLRPRATTGGLNATILSGRAAFYHRRFLSEQRRARKHRQLLKRRARARTAIPAALPEPRSKQPFNRFVGCVTTPPPVNSTNESSSCLAVHTSLLTFVVDSGASKTCINDPGVARWLGHQEVEMRAANGTTIVCPRSGLLRCAVDTFAFSLSDVVYAPEFTRNLLSLHSLVRSGVTCTVDSTATTFTFPCGTRLSAPLVNGCYLLQCSVVPVSGMGGTVFGADGADESESLDAPLAERLFAVGDLVMVPHTNWPTYSKAAKFPATGFERGRIIEFRRPTSNVYRYRVHFDRTDNSKAIIHEDLLLPDDPVGIHDCATCRTRFGDIAYTTSGVKSYYTHASGFCTSMKPVIALTPIVPRTDEASVPRPIAEPKPTQRTKPRKSKLVSHEKDQPLGSRDLTVPAITTSPPISDAVCSFPADDSSIEFQDLDFDPSIVREYSATTAHHSLLGDPAVYHARMSHLSLANTIKLQGVSDNFRVNHSCETFCETCAICKLTRKDKFKWLPDETEPGVLYHSDSGRMDPASSSGYTSYFLFVEHCSTYVYLYVTKGETAEDLTECLKLLARDTGRMPRQLHSDCGSAYLAEHTRKFCINHRIIQTFSTPYHKDENGIAEVATRTVKEGLRTLLVSSGVPIVLWPYALQVVVYTRNRAPLASRNNLTPYTILFSHQPNLDNLRVFGCSSYYLVQVPSNTVNGAFVPKARKDLCSATM